MQAVDHAGKSVVYGIGKTARIAAYIAAEDAARGATRSAAKGSAWVAAKSAVVRAAGIVPIEIERSALAYKSFGYPYAPWCAAIVNATAGHPQHDWFCAVWLPMVDAIEAGLFAYWLAATQVIVAVSPVLRIENNQLHADGRPAVQWSEDERYYFWRGVEIPVKYGAVPSEHWSSSWLLKSNVHLRRILIQGIGYDRLAAELDATVINTWREYSLVQIQAKIDVEPIHLLKMVCPSTNQLYVLRTPPELRSARAAIAWCN